MVFDLKSNLTVNTLTVTGALLTGTCGPYTFYGILLQNSKLTVTHPGISNTVYFWRVRIIYWLMTID
jgi:hypothetical protein